MIFLPFLAGAMIYCVLVIIAAMRFRSSRRKKPDIWEPVSILKPLAGLDEGLEKNLRTFFEQKYPDFELLFAVRDARDLAVTLVETLRKEYAHIPSRLIVTGEPPYPNAKVWSLDHMLREAKNDLVVMSDSDIRVTPDMLEIVAAEFAEPGIAVATCPYRAVPGASLWSKLEATGMNTDFLAGILVAGMLEGMKFAVGPTIVARRKALESIGGFARLSEFLAEDFMMGKLAAEAGHGVILSSYVIEHRIGTSDFRSNAKHRLRWSRSTRRSRPAGYIGQLFTMPVPIAAGLWIAAPSWWPLSVIALALRFAAAILVARGVLGAKLNPLLLPVEDFLGFFFWLAGFFGNTIEWRGRRYELLKDGRFRPV